MNQGLPQDFRRYLSLRGASATREEAATHQSLTLRALGVGAFLSLFLAVGTNYSDFILKGSYMTLDFSTPGAIFLFLVLIGFLNTLYKLTGRHWMISGLAFVVSAALFLHHFYPYDKVFLYSPGVLFSGFIVLSLMANTFLAAMGQDLALNRSELIVVYIMLIIVASLATMGLCETILPAITGIFYYANPENNWAELLFPHLPTEILLNDGNENTDFYEGFATKTYQIPWEIWLRPMFMWAIFLLAMYVTMISVTVILRRQWMDRERLSYPLVQAAQAMIRGEREDKLVNPFFKSKAMWAGAAIPIVVGVCKGLNFYLAGWPVITTAWSFPIGWGQSINMTLSFAVIGFSYLIGPDIAMGIWGFALLNKFERMAFVSQGITKQQDVWSVSVTELLNYQGLGALIVFVGLGLWVGREHLFQVGRKFLGMDSELSDDDEIMSYRAAVLGALVGGLVMTGWLTYLNTPLWASFLFVVVLMAVYTGLSRVVAEAGVAAIISPMTAPDFIVYGLGPGLLGASGITTISFTYIFAADIRVFLMGLCATGLKLIEGMDKRSRRHVFWAILIAIFLGITGSLYTVMELSYRDGGINSSGWFFHGMPNIIYKTAAKGMELEGVYWPGLSFLGMGGIGMLVLTWVRQRFLWWPLHPIGFPIMASWVVDWMWFSVFFAWLIKIIVLKYGGASLFARSRQFFLGMIAGRMLVTGGWLVVDYLTGVVGNSIFWI
ncbi:MAG: DUF6785 family protein [Candidatus Latescibacterota bacterium]|nr:DUF6785 family protein [Candidatus Latescibacterota bacterium]